MECTDSNVSIDKTSKNKVSAVGANSLYIRKPCTIFFYEKVVKWCDGIHEGIIPSKASAVSGNIEAGHSA